MADYPKYIITEPIANSHNKDAEGRTIRRNIFMLDGVQVPNAPYAAATWYSLDDQPEQPAHTHDFDEYLSFIGTDPENPEDLGATATMLLGEEWIDIEKSCLIFIPAGMPHSVFAVKNLRRPFLSFTGGETKEAYVSKSENEIRTIGAEGLKSTK